MYYYIFYKLYKRFIKSEEKWADALRMPAYNAMLVISVLINLNLITLYIVLVHYVESISYHTFSMLQALTIAVIILAVNYLLFIRNKKYIDIENRFDKDSDKSQKIKTIFFEIYIVLTIVLFSIIIPLFATNKH